MVIGDLFCLSGNQGVAIGLANFFSDPYILVCTSMRTSIILGVVYAYFFSMEVVRPRPLLSPRARPGIRVLHRWGRSCWWTYFLASSSVNVSRDHLGITMTVDRPVKELPPPAWTPETHCLPIVRLCVPVSSGVGRYSASPRDCTDCPGWTASEAWGPPRCNRQEIPGIAPCRP